MLPPAPNLQLELFHRFANLSIQLAKVYYDFIQENDSRLPTVAIEHWNRDLGMDDTVTKWQQIAMQIKLLTSVKLKSFNLSFINRSIVTQQRLYYKRVATSPICKFCGTVEHISTFSGRALLYKASGQNYFID